MSHKLIIILIILGGVAAAALGGYLLTQLYVGDTSGNSKFLARFNEGSASQFTPEPKIVEPEPIGNHQAVSPTISLEDNSVLFYEKGTGRALSTDLNSLRETIVSDTVLPKFLKTLWAPNKNEVISTYSTEQGSQEFEYFNYTTGITASLPSNTQSIAFSPDGSKIAYFIPRADGGIYLAQPDGSASKKIMNTRLENIKLFWQRHDLLSFQTEIGSTEQYEFFTLTNQGQFEKILTSKKDLKVNWFPDGEKLIYSSTESGKPKLIYKNMSTGIEQPIDLNTFADKCVWSTDASKIWCGIPTSFGLPSPDDIYSFNLVTRAKETIFLSGNPTIRINEIMLSPKEDQLLFINSYNNLIYRLMLPK